MKQAELLLSSSVVSLTCTTTNSIQQLFIMTIKDYLHLYLGCEVITTNIDGEESKAYLTGFTGMDELNVEVQLHNGIHADEEPTFKAFDEVKPILRPLSDMVESELKELAAICYLAVFDHDPEFNDVEIIADEYGGGLKFTEDEQKWNYGLTASDQGVMFSANGNFLNVSPFTTTKYLLSKHFDVFGLIDAGLAIDATTLSNIDMNAQECDTSKA